MSKNTASQTSRRNFLKVAGASLASTALGSTALSYSRIMASNDRVKVGIVGFSDRLRAALVPAFLKHADELNFEFIGISDIWNRRREEGVAYIHALTGKTVSGLRNNEELYARKDVDAALVATADFQHAYHAIEAIKAGCDAYVEKPLAHTMEDARAVRKAAHESARVVQIGTRRRSEPVYQRAHEYIKSGQFGDIVAVEMAWNVNQPGRWRRSELVAKLREVDTDWKRYLINRPFEPLMPVSISSFGCFGRIPPAFPINGWCTRSTPCIGSLACCGGERGHLPWA